jgi:hypothetical protein
MKKLILLFVLSTASTICALSQGKTDKNGLRTKKWKVLYTIENVEYLDPLNILPNWFESVKEINGENDAVLFEKVKYTDGKKEGKFEWFINEKKTGNKNMGLVVVEGVTYYPTIMKGTYINGKLHGTLSLYNTKTESKICDIEYLDGKPIDQNIIFSNQNIKIPGTTITQSFKEEFIFKNGTLVEINVLDNVLPQRYVKINDGWKVLKYTEKPYCFNNYSFLTKQEINDNNYKSLVELNINNVGLEVYSTNKNFEIEGEYRLFQTGSVLFDTTHLSGIVHFENGLRNGKATFWDRGRNGHSENPFITANYKNDKLHGKAVLYYSWLGMPAATMNFENGLLSGSLISFWDADKGYPFVGKNIAAKCTFYGGFLMPYQVGDFNQDILGSIEEFQKKGNPMEIPKGYFRFSEQNYVIDSVFNKKLNLYVKYSKVKGSYSWNSSENKSVYFWVIDNKGEVKDFAIMDENGKNIMTMSGLTETINNNLEKKRKEEEKILNTVIECEYCNGSVKIRDAVITWGGCDCFQDNNDKIGIYGTVSTYFCSQKCRVDYEKDCCKRQGYSYEKH